MSDGGGSAVMLVNGTAADDGDDSMEDNAEDTVTQGKIPHLTFD